MTTTVEPWVLCVDDEPRVLSSLTLSLGADYEVRTATGGAEALELLEAVDGCAVLISDMRMPGMDGAELLRRARQTHPDVPRILLTGFAELDAAMAAINEGQIFRFLLKPCPTDDLVAVVGEAMQLHRLRNAERELLEDTVNGILVTLSEILAVALPQASFGDSKREAVRRLRAELDLAVSWEVEAAALLARLGWLALTPELVAKISAGEHLTPTEAAQADRSTKLIAGVLRGIPRFSRVADLVESTTTSNTGVGGSSDEAQLAAVLTVERMALNARPAAEIQATLAERFDAPVVSALMAHLAERSEGELRRCKVRELLPGYVVAHDVCNVNGMLVLKQGTMLTPVFIERLRNYLAIGTIEGPVGVWVGKHIM